MAFLLPFLAQGIPWLVDEAEQLFQPTQFDDADFQGSEDDGY